MTYKATIIFGEQAASQYEETEIIPEDSDDGVVDTVEFQTKAEYDAYCKALNDAKGYYGWAIIPEKEYLPQIICTRCGGTDVTCGGVINPNTNQALEIGYEALYDGFCQKCGWAVLSHVEDALKSINEKYSEFKDTNFGEPLFAKCEIAHTDELDNGINIYETKIIGISPKIISPQKEKIFFNCKNIETLKSLIRPDPEISFVVIDCISISNNL